MRRRRIARAKAQITEFDAAIDRIRTMLAACDDPDWIEATANRCVDVVIVRGLTDRAAIRAACELVVASELELLLEEAVR